MKSSKLQKRFYQQAVLAAGVMRQAASKKAKARAKKVMARWLWLYNCFPYAN